MVTGRGLRQRRPGKRRSAVSDASGPDNINRCYSLAQFLTVVDISPIRLPG
jgi:hypothetical protein